MNHPTLELTNKEKEKGYVYKTKCSICGKMAYYKNPKLQARHQHIGFVKNA